MAFEKFAGGAQTCEGPGRLQLTTIDSPPRRFAAATLSVLRGKPKPWMAEAGYLSRRMEKLELDIKSPVMIDGECFQPPASGRIVITVGPVMRFYRF